MGIALALMTIQVARASEPPAGEGASTLDASEKSLFQLSGTIQASTSLHDPDDADRESELGVALNPGLSIGEQLSLSVHASFKKELENEMKSTLGNTKVALTHSALELNPFMSWSPAFATTIATSEESLQKDYLRFALHLQPGLTVDLSRLGLRGLTLTQGISLSKSFHEFRVGRTGASNTSHSLSGRLTAAYSVTDRIGLSASYLRAVGWTYGGSPKNNFELSEELSFALTPNLTGC